MLQEDISHYSNIAAHMHLSLNMKKSHRPLKRNTLRKEASYIPLKNTNVIKNKAVENVLDQRKRYRHAN